MPTKKLVFHTNLDGDHVYPFVEERHNPPVLHKERYNSDGSVTYWSEPQGEYKVVLMNFSAWMTERTQGRRLIDLGSGMNESISQGIGAKLGCTEVVGVDPFYAPRTRYSGAVPKSVSKFYLDGTVLYQRIPDDALTYLTGQAQGSAVIMANGLFTEPFIEAFGYLGWEQKPEWLKYLQELITEVYRVTSTVFFGNGMYPQIKELCEKTGFQRRIPYPPGPDTSGLRHVSPQDNWHPESGTPIFTSYNSTRDRQLFLFER